MKNLARALSELTKVFEGLKVPYAVMGGIAVRVYGIPRPTYDVDFTLALDRARLPELYRSVRELGYTVPEQYDTGWVDCVAGMPVVKVRAYLAEGRGIDIDIFLAESAFQEQLLARRRRDQVDDLSVWFVTAEDLILLKLLAHRPRDIADISDIRFTQGQLDEAYLHDWARRLGVVTELERIRTEQP